jgi:hypothetical protein
VTSIATLVGADRKRSPGNAENVDIAALSDVASGVSDDEAKSEIAENGKRRAPNAERAQWTPL